MLEFIANESNRSIIPFLFSFVGHLTVKPFVTSGFCFFFLSFFFPPLLE